MKKFLMVPMVGAAALTLAACGETATGDAATGDTAAATETANAITAADVEAAQTAWGEGIVAIGQVSTDGGDVNAAATTHINDFYGYEDGMDILFKPTLAAEDQFRGSFDEALSYFIGTEGTEDGGFALAPYTAVRWENEGTIIDETGDTAMAMGNYYFTGTDGNETKVEYTFGYERNDAGDLVIVLHHSSLPFSAQ
ncbi:phosphoribosyl-AMP cyclohydrolase [Aurantiacibacter sp. MUD61]|uniref:phosphoribosyl-AMP cyclohydrolase n=1 Tax=Aurantiacibacter sp. MUD61 TaxID=3009083 RepID=UPI0022F0C2B7|nr:phosphoribosyl-AMP cyclohydrolase [Aurantiacibacter sp. MUD61]